MEIQVKYNILGKIVEGVNTGWYVKFIDDRVDSGGFFIYEFKNLKADEGFDTWLENESDIFGYVSENGWKIKWLTAKEIK